VQVTTHDFNVNDHVLVKLTEHGRELRRRYFARLGLPDGLLPELKETDGWSRWQLWELMSIFGEHMYNGCRIPFETVIRVELP
jgi:hypothetical protein